MRKFILGSDWWTDCDDAVAIRLLCNLHRKKKLELIGVALSGCMEYSVKSLDAFLRDNGVNDIPIGIDLEATDFGGNPPYQKRLAELPSGYQKNEDAENPVKLYRRLLASAKDKVELIEIGYPQILAALLESEDDEFSALKGTELVRQKVEHLWIMAGKWDEPEGGRENNFCRNKRASEAAAKVCKKWPTSVTFLGWEVGNTVISGGKLPESDPLKQALNDHGSANGRNSWDPMLILLAAIGEPEKAGYDCIYGKASVDPENGANYFKKDAAGNHCYVVKTKPDEWYAEEIDSKIKKEQMNIMSKKLADINIRDPFILPVEEEKAYYLFGSGGFNCNSFICCRSADLENWEGPFTAFLPPEDFPATKEFWAPEVHFFQGRYYLFATFKHPERCRGCMILVSERPEGPYRLHSEGYVTPEDRECLDGTLYIDPEGQPWMVFCHEWVQIKDGTICAVRLSRDLRRPEGEVILLFTASDAPWVRSHSDKGGYVTDGPFLFEKDGKLCMYLSSFSDTGYSMGILESPENRLEGPWTAQEKPIFAKDGGHGMRFRTFDGKICYTVHSPNYPRGSERTLIFTED